ncbi:hypothetical protein K8638_10265 [Myxococcus sp. RHST-1-4]|nr:hypothetical protein [Myxococcus sp. RHSTA-1-4]MBZ4416867.1 hypothetical protein [Myxococcus sp. RHSTA-1-4]
MAANARWKGLPWIAATGAVVGVGLAVLLFVRQPAAPEVATPAPATARADAPVTPSAPSEPPPGAAAPTAVAGSGAVPDAPRAPEPPPAEGVPQIHPVDLEALRAKLPDNLYWELGAPTKDPEVLKRREDDARRWNDLYGKVLSGSATEEEVRQYYEHRRRVSEDFITFAATVLAEYGEQLPEQERGLYELSINMHRTRLAELPGQEQDALARRQVQEQRREAWRQGQQTP